MNDNFDMFSKILSIVVGVVGIVLTHRIWICESFKKKRERFWATFPIIGKFLIIRKAGIKTIFLHRDNIEKYRRQRDICDYITKNTEDSFTYVGVWLSESNELEKISECFFNLLKANSNLKIELYFRNSQMEHTDEIWFNDYYNCRDSKRRIEECIQFWKHWKSTIDNPHVEDRVKLYIHECNLTCSFFLFNSQMNYDSLNRHFKEIIYFDQKLYGCSKEQSISMEIELNHNKNAFYQTVKQMCQNVKSKSKEIVICR